MALLSARVEWIALHDYELHDFKGFKSKASKRVRRQIRANAKAMGKRMIRKDIAEQMQGVA